MACSEAALIRITLPVPERRLPEQLSSAPSGGNFAPKWACRASQALELLVFVRNQIENSARCENEKRQALAMYRSLTTRAVRVTGELKLGHRAYHVRCSSSGHIAAASEDGRVSVTGPSQALVGSFHLNTHLSAVSIAPDGQTLAATTAAGVELLDIAGSRLQAIAGRFVDAWFDARGVLWLAHRTSDSRFVIELYDKMTTKGPSCRVELEDPFGDSALMFHAGPAGGSVPLWVAAGQDGQAVYWLDHSGDELTADLLDDFETCLPPALSTDDGDHFLLVADDQLRLYDRDELAVVRRLPLPFEDAPVDDLTYLSPTSAALTYSDGLICVIDMKAMTSTEVVVTGHEPRPVSALYPTLREPGFCSDVARLLRPSASTIASVHRVLPDPGHLQHGSIVWWQTPQID